MPQRATYIIHIHQKQRRVNDSEVNLLWSTGNVALDHYLMPTMNNSLIQIGGPEKGKCGMRAEASLDHSHHEASAHLSLSSLPPKPQLEQELPYLYHELNASEGNISLGTVGG